MVAADCTQAHSIITLKEGEQNHFQWLGEFTVCNHNLRFWVTMYDTEHRNWNFHFISQIRTKSMQFPINCWSPPSVTRAMLFSSLSIYRKIWHFIKCAMDTNWVHGRLLILRARIWPIICVAKHRTMWICLWPATMKRKAPNCITSITLPMQSHWTTRAKDTGASLRLVFSIATGIQVSRHR